MQIADLFKKSSISPLIPATLDVAVVHAGFGNIGSVLNALEALGVQPRLSRDLDALQSADALILPGVGAFADGMRQLRSLDLPKPLTDLACNAQKPFLGICLGMQLMTQGGDEGGETTGLGWIDGRIVHFNQSLPPNHGLKIPHVGWNDVINTMDDPLLGPAGTAQSFYFVHSYHLQSDNPEQGIGLCDYGVTFPAVCRNGNIWGAQFHPEKSHRNGLRLLANFLGYAATQSQRPEIQDALAAGVSIGNPAIKSPRAC